jgi:hypothetical protein
VIRPFSEVNMNFNNLLTFVVILVLTAFFATESDAQTMVNTQSQAQTQSTAGATNAGNAQNINFNSEAAHDSTRLKTNPTVYAPSPSPSYSQLNCANGTSAGISGGFVGAAFGTVKEGDQCNGRANATMLMQMSNNFRSFDPITAGKLSTAAINIMCDQDDKVRAKLVAQGLCDASDYHGNERDYAGGGKQARSTEQRRMNEVYSPG